MSNDEKSALENLLDITRDDLRHMDSSALKDLIWRYQEEISKLSNRQGLHLPDVGSQPPSTQAACAQPKHFPALTRTGLFDQSGELC
jgi:hypothetical protein